MEEWDAYRRDQASAWLEHVYDLQKAMAESRDSRDYYETLADQARGLDYTRVKVSGGAYTDRMAEIVEKLEEVRGRFASNLAVFANESADAVERIDRMEDPDERRCLKLRYVHGLSWSDVAKEMSYSLPGIYHVRERAVLNAYDVMPREWRDPIPRAD